MTAADGFTLGLISGGAFALLESLGSLSNPVGDGWLFLISGRIGAGLLHMTASGLVGMGLASAWTQKKYFRLALVFLLAVSIHGAWNALSLTMGFLNVGSTVPETTSWMKTITNIGPFLLVGMGLVMILILIVTNRRLVRSQKFDLTATNPATSGFN